MTQSPLSKLPISMVFAAAVSLFPLAGPLHAAQVRQFTPQGELSGGQQRVTAVFTEDVVAAGNRDAASPFQIKCDVPSSYSYWESPKTWVYNLDRPLVLGQQCTFTLNPAAKTLKGDSFTGKSSFSFKVSKFQVSSIQPAINSSGYSEIHEDQVFIVNATGPVTGPANAQAIKQQVWCESDAVGQKIPIQILDAKAQANLPEEYRPEKSTYPANVLVFQCASNLPPKSKVQVVWGKGPNSVEERFAYTVREPFRATTSCERTQASAPCSPLSPLVLNLSSPVPTALLLKARLKHGKDVILPLDQGKRSGTYEQTAQSITFPAPLPAQASLVLELPKDVKDEAGRLLANADQFPLTIKTDALPPLAKFPGNFGVLEWKEGGLLPITLRNVEATLPTTSKNYSASPATPGAGHSLQQQHLTEDAQIIKAINELYSFESQSKFRSIQINGEAREYQDSLYAREVSFLQGKSNLAQTQLPKPAPSSETEVVGVPLGKPGFYVLEIQSQLLGNALLAKPKPMFVRASALVTNMAVHLKIGRNNSLVWVTSLDKGLPVPGAEVRVSDCDGKSLWQGKTDAQGRALVDKSIQVKSCASTQEYLFASARLGEDYSFVRSNWNEGIEPWRFGVATWGEQSQAPMHTVLDRTLFKPGETVHMKHFARRRTSSSFEFPDVAQLPKTLRIVHTGEGTEYTQNLQWDKQGTAINQWTIPTSAKMGQYSIELTGGREGLEPVGEFRVSDFRLPVFTGSVQAGGDQKRESQVGQKEVPIHIGLSFLNGGPAKNLKVEVSSTLRNKWLYFPAYPEFNFSSYLADDTLAAFKLSKGPEGEKLLLDKEQVTLNAQGTAQVKLALTPMPTQVSEVYTEVSFPDPNGEIQTIRGTTTWWPSNVLLGFKNGAWADASAGKKRIQLLALNTQGKPQSNQIIQVVGSRQVEYSHRRRVVGGFYAYENRSEYSDLGTVCRGKTDDKGLMWCEVSNLPTGRIHFMAQAKDEKGLTARAHTDLMVGSGGGGDDWYSVGSQDRMDVLPEKTVYKPGEVARIQVRTPFADSTALVAIESESVLETLVVPLSRFKPMVEIPIKAEWGPNVFVSVLNVRGRVQPLTWTSFFSWGWREPLSWLKQWWSPDQATAMVDLAKPSFRMGLNGFEVGTQGFELKVQVAANQATYKPGDKVKATLKVTDPQGKPVAAGTEVLLAVVDQALLELRPNESWNLLDKMLQARPYLVETSTAQIQVVGKRHFGKKAVPAGGGGGKAPARELFDTLVTWQPSVKLDAKGEATVEFTANDSLSAFQMVAIATSGAGLFGTGKAQYQSRQDLQLISGLPPLVREGDQVHAMMTVRNTTTRTMQIAVTPVVRGLQLSTLKAQSVSLKPDSTQELSWVYQVPELSVQAALAGETVLSWSVLAQESSTGTASDEIKITQLVKPKVPLQVQQSGLIQVDGTLKLPVVIPPGALPGRGGVNLALSPSIAVLPAGVTQFFQQYPFSCLEQQVSKAIGLQNQGLWNGIADRLPSYQDSNGLLRYFPSGDGVSQGDAVLTAYVLNMALLGDQLYGFKLSAEKIQSLKKGLTAYVEGRVGHNSWSPREDSLQRKLQALEALTRAGEKPALAASALEVNVLKQPTSALIDWYLVLQRVPAIKQQAAQLQAVQNELRNRLTYAGGRLLFSTEDSDFWWWMMGNADVNAFRLLEAVLTDPLWKPDLAQLLKGGLERQIKGQWVTTTANAWASVAIERYRRQEEKQAVTGNTLMQLAKADKQFKWPEGAAQVVPNSPTFQTLLPWPSLQKSELKVQHQGTGKPWVDYQIVAAVPTTKPVFQGYQLKKTITPIEQREKGKTSRGDVWRVDVDIDAGVPMTWVAFTDAIPAGAKILGDGDGRDSQIIQAQAMSASETIDSTDSMRIVSPSFIERGFDSYRAYFEYLPKGKHKLSYTVRINNPGQFNMPASRIEAMYAPGTFAELPNPPVVVQP